ncbi:LysR family transcriptional regulator [Govanella unica]|uniref:LysR family transcriptional regulator n=1 Tax=Govanella unica TaxID=2975056 RepID=A0A9X3Z6L9_9PROT|nr:LysR family transcriptional regulator [Govania unica]MDA5193158.1 LysR family transcriptional regulator [Govania unica]
MDKLTAMQVFAAVVDEGSFSAAAARLNMAKSAVSTLVKTLEAELGVTLLNRTTRKVSLTEAGQRYKDRAEQILSDVEDADREAAALTATPRGTLRVSAGVSFGTQELGKVVATFLATYPEVRIDLQLTDRFVDLLDEGFDLAVRIGELRDSSLIARKLTSARRLTCASPDYLEAHGTPQHPNDLRQHNCLGYSGGGWSFQEQGRPLIPALEGRLIGNNGDVLCAAAVAGSGIVFAPSFILGDDIRAGRLVPILTAYEAPPVGIYAIYPPSRHISAKLRAFIDSLSNHCGSPPSWEQGLP